MHKTIFGIFHKSSRAHSAAYALIEEGHPVSQIGILADSTAPEFEIACDALPSLREPLPSNRGPNTLKGLVVGVVFGGLAMLIPGVGANTLVIGLGMAVAAVIGAVIGALFAESPNTIVLTADVATDQIIHTTRTMQINGAVAVHQVSPMWRNRPSDMTVLASGAARQPVIYEYGDEDEDDTLTA